MNESQFFNLKQNSTNTKNQNLGFMLEIKGRVEDGQLKCYVNNINNHYLSYFKIKRKEIIGNRIWSLKDDFVNIYCQIIDYFWKNPAEESIHIYVKKIGENLEIVNLGEIKNEKCELWQIVAYTFNRDTDLLEVFIFLKDISKEICSMKEEFSIKDIKNYNDIIMNLSDLVSNLSHAWRQPLNSLNFSIINLMDEIDSDTRNCEIVEEYYKEIWQIIKSLSLEIEKFKEFFEMDYKKEVFDIDKYLDLVIEILDEKIKKEHIKIDVRLKEKIKTYGSPNEFLQIMYCVFFDIIEHCRNGLDIHNRGLSIEITTKEQNVFFDIKAIYDTNQYKDFELSLNHLSMFKNIIPKKMEGTIELINNEAEKKVTISFPLNM